MSDPELERLREWTEVTGEEVGELHRAVMARVAARRRRPYWWLAAAAALMAAVAVGWSVRAPMEEIALTMPAAPRAPEVRFTPKAAVARAARVTPAARETRASVIKIFTDDRDVVILLVSDGGEE